MFTLSFLDGGMPRAHRLREGETIIGRAPTCELVITAPLMSRAHARVRVAGNKVFVRDAGSSYGGTWLEGLVSTDSDMPSRPFGAWRGERCWTYPG